MVSVQNFVPFLYPGSHSSVALMDSDSEASDQDALLFHLDGNLTSVPRPNECRQDGGHHQYPSADKLFDQN